MTRPLFRGHSSQKGLCRVPRGASLSQKAGPPRRSVSKKSSIQTHPVCRWMASPPALRGCPKGGPPELATSEFGCAVDKGQEDQPTIPSGGAGRCGTARTRCRSQLLPGACVLHTQNRERHHARGTVERIKQRRQPGIMFCSPSGPASWSEGPRQAQSQRSVHSPPSRCLVPVCLFRRAAFPRCSRRCPHINRRR